MTSRFTDVADVKRTIRSRIVELATRRHIDATDLKDSDVIPDTGVLDSAGIMELVIWFEMTFSVTIAQSDLTVENFGTIDAMVNYLQRVQR